MAQFTVKVLDIETLPQFKKLHPADQGRLLEFDQSTRFALERIVKEIFTTSSYHNPDPKTLEQLEGIMNFILSCPQALAVNHMEALRGILFGSCAIHLGPFHFMYDSYADRTLKALRGYLFEYDVITEETGFQH